MNIEKTLCFSSKGIPKKEYPLFFNGMSHFTSELKPRFTSILRKNGVSCFSNRYGPSPGRAFISALMQKRIKEIKALPSS